MKFKLSGDICHPGLVEVEVENVSELWDLLDKSGGKLRDEEAEFKVYDEQSDCLLFIWDGTAMDDDGNEVTYEKE